MKDKILNYQAKNFLKKNAKYTFKYIKQLENKVANSFYSRRICQ